MSALTNQMADVTAVLGGDARWALVKGDCLAIMEQLPELCVDHVITDPPYSKQVHASVRTSKRNRLSDVAEHACRARRVVDLGFEHLSAPMLEASAVQFARLVRRWVLAFSDVESSHLWRGALGQAGLKYKRTGAWVRRGGAPQFSGDRPAAGFEAITMAHRVGRTRWNGGGRAAVYSYPIVANRAGARHSRIHPTQKPLALMLELVELFTDPGDLVLDPYAGSATTGVACLRLGRRFIGCELDAGFAATARERLAAHDAGLTLKAARAGQVGLFGGAT